MGNGASSAGSVFLELDEDTYTPGDVVRGKAHFMLNEMTELTEIRLKISGQEKVHFETQEQESYEEYSPGAPGANEKGNVTKFRTVTKHHYAKREIFKVNVPMTHNLQAAFQRMSFWNGRIITMPPGQYTIPFQVPLPSNLPGSVSLHNKMGSFGAYGNNFSADCLYKVKAVLARPNLFKSDLKCTRQITVIEKPPYIMGATAEVENPAYAFCCCWRTGTVKVRMATDKNAYKQGDQISVGCAFTNESSYEIPALHCELKRTVKLRADNGRTHTSQDVIVASQAPTGCAPGQSATAQFQMTLLGLRDNLPTCLAHNIEVSYFLDVRGSLGSCRAGVEAEIPVCLYTEMPLKVYQPPPTPANWNPMTFDYCTFNNAQAIYGANVMNMQRSSAYNQFVNGYQAATADDYKQFGFAQPSAPPAININVNVGGGGNPPQQYGGGYGNPQDGGSRF